MPLPLDDYLLDEDVIRTDIGVNSLRGISHVLAHFGQWNQGDAVANTVPMVEGPSASGGNFYGPYQTANNSISPIDEPKLRCRMSWSRNTEIMGVFYIADGTVGVVPNNYKTGYAASQMFGFEFADEAGEAWSGTNISCIAWDGGGIVRLDSGVTPAVFPNYNTCELQLTLTTATYIIDGSTVQTTSVLAASRIGMRWSPTAYYQPGWTASPVFYCGNISVEWNRKR